MWRLPFSAFKRLFQGTLKRRPLGKPKYQPTGREKVAQTPPEWRQSGDGE
jgi:hypothetical protein